LKNRFESFRPDYLTLIIDSPNWKVLIFTLPQVFISFTTVVSSLQLRIKKGIKEIKIWQKKVFFYPKKHSCNRSFIQISKKNSRFEYLKEYELRLPACDKTIKSPVEKKIDFVKKFLYAQTLQLKPIKYLNPLLKTYTVYC
jgi:hypothetical protein